MRWLQWSTYNLESGFGGVEMHARCLNRELRKLGVDSFLSRDPSDLKKNWDVVHTHGTGVNFAFELTQRNKKYVRVHGVHGTTIGRMAACREWTWPGGYLAATKEFLSLLNADVVLADHKNLFLYDWARKLGKTAAVISNGWDSFRDGTINEEALPEELARRISKIDKFWIYYGRGSDPVKAVDRLFEVQRILPSFVLVASTGEGFELSKQTIRTGTLSQGQLKRLSTLASGLVLTSKYEGLPLVIMEALGEGLPVVSTPVGGITTLSQQLDGLFLSADESPQEIAKTVQYAEQLENSPDKRKERATHNRSILPSWNAVARSALLTVESYLKVLT